MTAESGVTAMNAMNLTNLTKSTITQDPDFLDLRVDDFYEFFTVLSFNQQMLYSYLGWRDSS